MDEQNFKDLAHQAWELYKKLDEMMRKIDDVFWGEFCCLSEIETLRSEEQRQNNLPF